MTQRGSAYTGDEARFGGAPPTAGAEANVDVEA